MQAKKEREEQYKPRLLIDVNLEQSKQKEREKERALERQHARERDRDREAERERDRLRAKEEREKYIFNLCAIFICINVLLVCRFIVQQAAQELAAVEAEPIDSDSDMDDNHFSPAPPEQETSAENEPAQVSVTIYCTVRFKKAWPDSILLSKSTYQYVHPPFRVKLSEMTK